MIDQLVENLPGVVAAIVAVLVFLGGRMFRKTRRTEPVQSAIRAHAETVASDVKSAAMDNHARQTTVIRAAEVKIAQADAAELAAKVDDVFGGDHD